MLKGEKMKSWFLYVWLVKYKCWYPVKIYHSKSYAKKVAMEKGYLKFKIVYREFQTPISYEIYRMNEDEYGNQEISLGYSLWVSENYE